MPVHGSNRLIPSRRPPEGMAPGRVGTWVVNGRQFGDGTGFYGIGPQAFPEKSCPSVDRTVHSESRQAVFADRSRTGGPPAPGGLICCVFLPWGRVRSLAVAMDVSLYVECWQEAARHKWIESQNRGYDLGEEALVDWFRRYWPLYCRVARLEHLAGRRRWTEFPDADFNLLNRLAETEDQTTIEWIIERAWQGHENLNLIDDAREFELPMDRVIHILTQLHLNLAQLEPPPLSPPQFAPPRTLRPGN